MRIKLQSFADFAATLLPHETAYLLSIQKFDDALKQGILERVNQNCLLIHPPANYDAALDKRKYSSLKTWITDRLHESDVDAQFEWMNDMERKIMTDAIRPEEERTLLRTIRRIGPTHFFFVKFYELAQTFRHFLLIRLRYDEHRIVNEFLNTNRTHYESSKKTYEQLHEATLDIVSQYSTGAGESNQWQEWLAGVFYNDHLDGLNRYLALIRLIFVHLNYGNLTLLLEQFEHLDRLFANGTYYSKRLLLNYYSQRLLLHSKCKDYEKAAYYGYLSIRGKNSDYLHYVNNLAAVLMRAKKYKEALVVMKGAAAEAKTTRNFHSKVGFVAFYIKCLNHNRQFKNAENYASAFLKAYKKEIFKYRWHLFFTAYFDALFRQGKYTKLLQITQLYQLQQKDREYQIKATYLPVIPWYCEIADYCESGHGLQQLADNICIYINRQQADSEKLPLVWEFLEEVKERIPDLNQMIAHKLREKGRGGEI
jgi:hypothetical protein